MITLTQIQAAQHLLDALDDAHKAGLFTMLDVCHEAGFIKSKLDVMVDSPDAHKVIVMSNAINALQEYSSLMHRAGVTNTTLDDFGEGVIKDIKALCGE